MESELEEMLSCIAKRDRVLQATKSNGASFVSRLR